MIDLIDVRCPNCRKLLLRAAPGSLLEIKCERCKMLVAWPTLTAEIKTQSSEGENHERDRAAA